MSCAAAPGWHVPLLPQTHTYTHCSLFWVNTSYSAQRLGINSQVKIVLDKYLVYWCFNLISAQLYEETFFFFFLINVLLLYPIFDPAEEKQKKKSRHQTTATKYWSAQEKWGVDKGVYIIFKSLVGFVGVSVRKHKHTHTCKHTNISVGAFGPAGINSGGCASSSLGFDE